MKTALLVGMLLSLGFCASTVIAAPGGDIDEKPWSYQLTPRATIPELEPNDTCPGQAMDCGNLISPAAFSSTTDDDWYFFNVHEAGTWLTLYTQPLNGSSIDTYLELYDLCDGSPPIAQDDDSGPGLFSLITHFQAPHAGWYFAKCYTYHHQYTGDYEFIVCSCNWTPAPDPNDLCADALPIPRCGAGSVNGDLVWATNDYDPGSGGCASGFPEAGKDLTYVVDLEAGDILQLLYAGNNYDAAFYIVTDCANVAGTCVAGADAAYDVEAIHWTCTATGTYYIICDAYGTDSGGTYSMTYQITCPESPFVCCVAGVCQLVLESDCGTLQGEWHPEWSSCDGDPCAAQGAGNPAWNGAPFLTIAPQPSLGSARITYALRATTSLRLEILDAAGRVVRHLADGAGGEGPATAEWDGRDGAGRRVARGTYFCRLSGGGEVITERLIRIE